MPNKYCSHLTTSPFFFLPNWPKLLSHPREGKRKLKKKTPEQKIMMLEQTKTKSEMQRQKAKSKSKDTRKNSQQLSMKSKWSKINNI